MATGPTGEQLALVAQHGSGALERALATVMLARRRGREQELKAIIADEVPEKRSDGGTRRRTGPDEQDDSGLPPKSAGDPSPPPNSPEHDREPSNPEVRNVVAAGSLGRPIDLDAVGEDIEQAAVVQGDAAYPPDRLRVRRKDNGPLLYLFTTGNYQITGARSVAEERDLLEWFVGQLEQLGFEELDVSFGIENVVVRADLGGSLDLHKLQSILGYEKVEYEPELDNALMYRPDAVDTAFRIYSSGRLVFYTNSIDVVDSSFEWLREIL